MEAQPKKSDHEQNNTPTIPADRIVVTYYTDPLCCWSWAFESHWQRFCRDYKDVLEYKYVMGGMISSWKTFNDPMNAISTPQQMGPMWMYASQVTGVEMNYTVWHVNPPASSYPACLAVKCAMLQSPEAGEHYLLKVREAVMLRGEDVSRHDVLLRLALQLAKTAPRIFDAEKFNADMKMNAGHATFKADLQQAAYHKIGRFPTLTFVNGKSAKGLMIVGFRPYEALQEVMQQVRNG